MLVENFSPRVMPSLGLDYDSLREIAPHLVMVSISNFGQTGPYRDYKATDIVEYALGGLMYIFGAYDREPLKHAFNQAQFKAGNGRGLRDPDGPLPPAYDGRPGVRARVSASTCRYRRPWLRAFGTW